LLRPNPEYVRELIEVINASSFPDHMSMLLTEMDLDRALLEIKVDRRHLQIFEAVHGGVFSTLIDAATFWSAFMRIPEEAGLVNIDLKLNYLKAVEKGVLIAEGRTIRAGNSISYAEASVWNESRQLVAHGTSTLMTLPGKGALKLSAPKFLDGNS
jgi:uncharacterized protein (TIGR00369 family)